MTERNFRQDLQDEQDGFWVFPPMVRRVKLFASGSREAGYAHALGKIPIYVAREGTKLEFDLKKIIQFSFSRILEN
jgi:hypothetical protein